MCSLRKSVRKCFWADSIYLVVGDRSNDWNDERYSWNKKYIQFNIL